MKIINYLIIVLASILLSACGGSGDSGNSSTGVTQFNSPPTLSGIPSTAMVNEPFSFEPTLYDKENDPVSLSAKNLPSWLTINNNVVTGTPTANDIGNYSITFVVSDGKHSSQYLIALQVVAAQSDNLAPTIAGQVSDAVIDQAFYFEPSVYDPEQDDLSFSVTNLPNWLSFNYENGSLSGTPQAEHIGSYNNIIITVSDGINTARLTFDITVKQRDIVNTPPSVTVQDHSITANTAFSYAPSISDPENDPLTLAIHNAPDWLTFNVETGQVSGTPTNDDTGVYDNIKIVVSDGQFSVNALFKIEVTAELPNNTAPRLTGNAEDAIVGQAYQFMVSAEDDENDELTFTHSNLPQWLQFDEAMLIFSGTPELEDIGTYNNITLTVSDGQLNSSLTFSITVIDAPNTAPTISGTPGDATVGSAYQFTPNAQDNDSDTLSFTVTNLPTWASFNTSTGAISGTPQNEHIGNYSNIIITVTDGSATAALTISINVVAPPNTAPTISGTPSDATVGVAYQFTPSAQDDDGDTLSFTVTNLPNWASFNTATGAISGTPQNEHIGSYSNIVITVTDGGASAALTISINVVAPPNTAPTISGTPGDATVGVAYQFTPSAQDDDGDTLSFTVTNLPTWASFNTATGAISGTPQNEHIGSYSNIIITVTDGSATAALTISINVVAPPNTAPTISGTPGDATVGVAYQFTPSAQDNDSDTLSFTVTNLPNWASFNTSTGAISGTPQNEHIGSYSNIIITVTDGGASAALTISINVVAPPNTPPTIFGTPSDATVGVAYQFTPSAQDDDGETLSFTVTNLPTWASFNTGTGAISGIPQNEHIGSYSNIIITVTDGSASTALTISINVVAPPNTPPTISGTPADATVGNAYQFTPSAQDDDGDTLSFTVTNLPNWASFNTSTGAISGTPQNEHIGSYSNIIITVTDGGASAALTISINVVAPPNTPPTISGTPADATVGNAYQFTPSAQDDDGDTLSFTVTNLPNWASFNTSTGAISGTPQNEYIGSHSNIVITVTDGIASAALTVSIKVVAPPNTTPTISGTPGDAVAGSSYQFIPDVNDNEGDTLSFTITSKPIWASFNINTGELSGTPTNAHVGLYSNIAITVSDGELKSSLFFDIQVIKSNNLPTLITTHGEARIDEPLSLSIQVNDPDNDVVSIRALNLPNWLSFNSATNELSGTPTDDTLSQLSLNFELDDGYDINAQTLTLIIEKSWVQIAIETGNALVVPGNERILDAALEEIDSHKARFNEVKRQLFKWDTPAEKLTAIDWQPTHDAALFAGQYPFNDVVLYTTNSNQSGGPDRVLPIAIAGSEKPDSGRYMVYGANPFRNGINEQMNQFMVNTFDWLTQTNTKAKTSFNVVLTQLDESYWFKDRSLTRNWLDTNYTNVSYNNAGDCDGSLLASCITNQTDVIIISRMTRDGDDKAAVIQSVKNALGQDIPVVYIQLDGGIGEHGRELLNVFKVTHKHDNYWWKLYLSGFNPETVNDTLPTSMLSIKTLLTNFKQQSFNVDLTGCSTRSCPTESNTQSEFFDGANAIKAMFNEFDSQKQNIFNSNDYRLNKLIILLADHYRQSVTYPMDKIATNTVTFFKSLFADYAVYNVRSVNPIQPDMGNFSRSDFSHVTPTNVQVPMVSKSYFRSTGVYALPGRSFTITRNDNADVTTQVFINTLRTGATHIFNDHRYNRPYLLQSQRITVLPGESVTLTSSYGGPVQIAFDKKDVDVNFTFSNVGQHAHWRSPADDESFAQKMQAGDYDWAEIATAGFEVHSKHTKLQASLSGSIWPTASDFANATSRYTHNLVHVLAGFKGPGIDIEPEIHDFVTDRGLEVDTIDIVKHMNADQPTCGWGCSGNPYDAGWNFHPTGHGDLHELGHGIERSSMRFEGYGGHSNTNFYSYFSKSVYEDETGEPASCQSLPFQDIFNTLQQSKLDADPVTYMQNNLTKSWSEHHAIYIQLMMAAQAENKLNNGWFIYPRLHIWEREFYRADNSDESWDAKKVGLGFDTYTRTDLSSLTRNEWLYISLSEITALDLTDWFTMYGFTVGDKAKAQVKSKGYSLLSERFYTSSGNGYCSTLIQNSLPVDGTQVWPTN